MSTAALPSGRSRGFSRAAGALLLPGFLVLLLQGCAVLDGRIQDPAPVRDLSTGAPVPPSPVPAPPVPAVAVVLSADSEHYRAVADALGEGNWQRYLLTGDAPATLERIRDGGHRAAIAIGQRALSLLADSDLEVAYCQVLNVAAARAVTGVEPLPRFGPQLDAWRARQPGLTEIGLITGAGHAFVAEALQAAARERSMVLHHQAVQSDRELLYVFRRMVPAIQGFVLYPDTSVLSPGAIRELLAYARKHGVRVLTYNRAIFELGADFMISANPDEVARRVVGLLGAEHPAAAPTHLDQVVIEARDAARAEAG